jgi:hypothetical protein
MSAVLWKFAAKVKQALRQQWLPGSQKPYNLMPSLVKGIAGKKAFGMPGDSGGNSVGTCG